MAAVDLPAPRPGGATGAEAELVLAAAGREFTLRIFDAGLACCAVEVAAAVRRAQEAGAGAGPAGAGGSGAVEHVLVVAGTVTDKLAPLVRQAFDDTPEPRRVMSFGACSNSGGPYWDSYCVTKGVDQIVPVDVYVPGCPPRPETLLDGLRALLGLPGPEAGS